ncbi:MAG: hypothetical protein ABSC08_12500 [Bryobacteraceae bacterium]
MPGIIRPGQGLLYMKVGTHARESIEDIIARKTKEIEDAGLAFWGYGGNTCHPQTMVQPFARKFERQGGVIYLCMQPMESKHFAEQIAAVEYSADGSNWVPIPKGVKVLGSRYALLIKNLRQEEFELPLDRTKVALGTSMGATGSKYIAGRVDKACLEIVEESAPGFEAVQPVHIGWVAELVAPHAVYVRNR